MISSNNAGWIDAAEVPFPEHSVLTVSARIRYLRSLFRVLADRFCLPIVYSRGINLTHMGIQFPLSGVELGLTQTTLTAVNQLLLSFTAKRPVKVVNDFSRPFTR